MTEKTYERASLPEPVCRWVFGDFDYESECGKHVAPDLPYQTPYPFCPYCRKKVEVVE